MSHLSDLNPTPSSKSDHPHQVPLPGPLPEPLPEPLAIHKNTPRHGRKGSITSPGLEALATAASNTAPLVSPPIYPTPFSPASFESTLHHSSHHQDAEPYDMHPKATFSPIPAQSQHTTIGERRASDQKPPNIASSQPYSTSQSNSSLFTNPGEPDLHTAAKGHGMEGSEQISPASNSQQAQDFQSHAITSIQIRLPPPGPNQYLPAAALPEAQGEQVQVKTELNDVLMQSSQDDKSCAIQAGIAPMELVNVKRDTSNTPSPGKADDAYDKSLLKPKAAPSRKRPAPRKGTVSSVKPAPKKRKLDTDSVDGSPSRGTPATSRTSATPAPRNFKQSSVTPTRSSSVAGPEEEDYEDDTQLFCICRKPDDHGVMIGCEGACDDWFHLKCVDMTQEKTKLVHKWYCPNCAAMGNETLWKRMCRLPGCSEPARQDNKGKHVSKYCTDAHAEAFMRRLVYSHGEAKESRSGKTRGQQAEDVGGKHGGEDLDDLRGGVLRPGELKALVDGVKDVNEFHRLGEGVSSPPKRVNTEADDDKKDTISYTAEETAQLEHVGKKREDLIARRSMLNDRDKFVAMVEARHKAVLAELKETDKSLKDVCGYDARLTWCDGEFDRWRSSAEGQKALRTHTLPAPLKTETVKTEASGTAPEEDGEEIGRGVCKKKRCERHRAWLKNQQQDNAFEKDLVRQGLRRLQHDEKGIRDRAMVRSLEREDG
ncbi:MAG: hypothetical protein Q9163_002239 [Psora crenata]